MRKLILTILLLSGTTKASLDDGEFSSFELIRGVQYSKGTFNLERGDDSIFLTLPQTPSLPKAQAVLVHERTPLRTEETVLVPGEDGRRQVNQVEKFPWSIHGQMTMEFGGRQFSGSGVLVGPHHFLTAAHCVYKPETRQLANNIKVRLGLNGSVASFEEVLGVKLYIYNKWINSRSDTFDFALIVLNQSIGLQTGWGGLLCLDDDSLRDKTVHVTGYPGDKGFRTLWTMDGKISRVEPEKLYYGIDTYGGQSGGAIWIYQWGMPHIVGNHAYSGILDIGGNFGVRLCQKKITDLAKWISDTFVIEDRTRRSTCGSIALSSSRATGIHSLLEPSAPPAYSPRGGRSLYEDPGYHGCVSPPVLPTSSRGAGLGVSVSAGYPSSVRRSLHSLLGEDPGYLSTGRGYVPSSSLPASPYGLVGSGLSGSGRATGTYLRPKPSARPEPAPEDDYRAGQRWQEGLKKDGSRDDIDLKKAAEFYKKAAAKEYAPAQFMLGEFYLEGLGGVEKDEKEAFRLYERAASQGHAQAEWRLGRMYENGLGGVEKDLSMAFNLYQRAVAQNFYAAKYDLGRMYEDGLAGLEKNDGMARNLYSEVHEATKDNYFSSFQDDFYFRYWLMLHERRGFEYVKFVEDCRRSGTTPILLGFMHQEGLGGLEVDCLEASRIYHNFLNSHSTQEKGLAMYLLGKMYEQGLGLDKNKERALKFYKEASKRYGCMVEVLAAERGDLLGGAIIIKKGGYCGSSYSQYLYPNYARNVLPIKSHLYFLGDIHKKGKLRGKKDSLIAERFYRIAADYGCEESEFILKRLLLSAKDEGSISGRIGIGGRPIYLYRTGLWDGHHNIAGSAKMGYAPAQNRLGFMFECGEGVGQDEVEALRLYRLSAAQNYAPAQTNLGWMYEKGRGGLKANLAEAKRFYNLASDQNHPSALYFRGRIHEKEGEIHAAVSLYDRAAVRKHAEAQYRLGRLYLKGQGGLPKDLERGQNLIKSAASQGLIEARDLIERKSSCSIL